MKLNPLYLKPQLLSLGLIAVGTFAVTDAQAQVWSTVGGGSWPTTTNWTGGTAASGTDAVADFTAVNIAADATVTLDGARTVGTIKFGDATTASNNWILNTGTGGPLTMDVTTGQAIFNVINGRTATINAVVAGNDGVNMTSATTGTVGGNLILAAANTFTGGLTITGGNVQVNSSAALGSNTVTIAASANTGIANKLIINGGVAIPNNVIINAGSTGLVGRGVVEQVGTGQSTVNGAITINGGTAAGGHFLGGAAVGNELVLGGPITSSVSVSQRDGRIIYRGGGNGYSSLGVTGTALVGATNGIPTGVSATIGASAAATLDLNGFDQTLAQLTLGVGGSAGNLVLGSKTLTLNGALNHAGTAVANITATAGGTINSGVSNLALSVSDTAAADDLVITGASFAGSGINKTGPGTLSLRNVNLTQPLTIATGGLSGNFSSNSPITISSGGTFTPGTATTATTIITPAVTFDVGNTTLNINVGPTGDLIAASSVAANGVTTVNVTPIGGALAVGSYPFLTYGATSPGLGGFILSPIGRASAELEDTGTAIALKITATDSVRWDGNLSADWDTNATLNWKLVSDSSNTNFLAADNVIFQDAPTSPNVTVATAVQPSAVNFTNTTATSYLFTGAAGINGPAVVNKTGNGDVILRNLNAYVGATNLQAGTLELDHDATGNIVLSGTSGVAISAGAKLKLTRDDGAINLTRSLSGAGAIEINPHSIVGGAVAHSVTLTGDNSGFSGTLRLLAPQSGTYRLGGITPTQLGTSSITVESGGQIFTVTNLVYPNAINIAGIGYLDANGNIGALRLENGSNWSGPIVVDNTIGARIGAHNTTATVSGSISGGDLTVNANNYNNNYTLIFTGTNSYGKTIIGGGNTQTVGVSSRRLNIGNGGTTGTLGAGPVEITGDGQNGVLGFDRSDGYTLAAGQTITANNGAGTIVNSVARTFLDVETTGSGLNTNGNAITLGASTSTAVGGQVRVAQARAGAIFNIDSVVTCGLFRAGSNLRGTTNLNAGGTINAATINVGIGSAAANGSVLNIAPGSTVNANYMTLSEVASAGGIVNQTGGDVSIVSQFRVGHFGTESSVYNMSGGTLTLTGANSINFPYTTGAGGAGAVGDNNLDGSATATIVGGGMYIGNDGNGVFNQSGGTVSTNWIVLDNRGNSDAGTNMPNGNDIYALSGGTLILKTAPGIISRNASVLIQLSGGTIQAASGVSPNLDSNKIAVTGPITLDTNGANTFTLYGPLAGTGSINLIGGGTLTANDGTATNTTPGGTMPGGSLGAIAVSIASGTNLTSNRSVADVWSGNLTGTGNLVKTNINTLTLTGSAAGFTGTVSVDSGRLDLPANTAAASINIADNGSLSGEVTTTNLTVGTTGGAKIFVDPSTAGALTTTNLNINGTNFIEFTGVPAPGVITLLNYTNKTGTGTLELIGATGYRIGTIVDTGTSYVLTFSNKNLVWTGSGGNAWDVNSTLNWDAGGAETFFLGDAVLFNDTALNFTVNLVGEVKPSTITLDSTNNYTFVSNPVNTIGGSATLIKRGTSTLTLSGANGYSGLTDIQGGTLVITSPDSLGNGAIGNTIAISGGAVLSSTAGTSNLGVNRNIAIGAGGGRISHDSATAAAITIPGKLSGTGPLSFHSKAAGAGSFILTGDNSGYTGDISVDAPAVAGGLTVLRIAANKAAPGGGSITLNYPTAGATGNATTLDLVDVSLPAAVGVNLTTLQSGAISLRSQITSTGVSSVNGPITVKGTSIAQISIASGTMALNGPITEGAGGFTGTLFLRGNSSGTVNNTITLPTGVVAKTDGGTWIINSTGNSWATTSVVSTGTMRLGANNALPISATLSIGQSDGSSSLLDLNGFNQEVANLVYVASTANNTRGITNSSATQATFTVNNAAANTFGTSTGFTGGVIAGNLRLVKNGAGTLTLGGANTFTGDLILNAGSIIAGGAATTNLGSATTAGRNVTLNNGTTIELNTNNVFGNAIGNANLPTINLNDGATLTTSRYNSIGTVNLNGSTLTSVHGTADSFGYQSWNLRGAVNVLGSVPSTISGTGDFPGVHVAANTTFNVADVTGNSAADLTITVGLLNQSTDFAGAPGGFTKTGTGTMSILGSSTATGNVTVSAGTLLIENDFLAPVLVQAGGTLGGNGSIQNNITATAFGSAIAPGASVGVLNAVGSVNLSGTGKLAIEIDDTTVLKSDKLAVLGPLNIAGATLNVTVTGTASRPAYIIASYDTLSGTFGATNIPSGYTLDYAYNDGVSTKNIALVLSTTPYGSFVTGYGLDPLTTGAPTVDYDNDGIANGIEFVLKTDPTVATPADKLPTIAATPTDVIFTFRRNDASAASNPGAQKSTSMTATTWENVTTGIAVEDDGFELGVDKVTVTIPRGTEERLFVRLFVTIP